MHDLCSESNAQRQARSAETPNAGPKGLNAQRRAEGARKQEKGPYAVKSLPARTIEAAADDYD